MIATSGGQVLTDAFAALRARPLRTVMSMPSKPISAAPWPVLRHCRNCRCLEKIATFNFDSVGPASVASAPPNRVAPPASSVRRESEPIRKRSSFM